MANSYNFSSKLNIDCIVTREDDLSKDTSSASLDNSTSKSGSDDVCIYQQQDVSAGHSFTLSSINDGLGDGSLILTKVYALCIKNIGSINVFLLGNFLGTVLEGDIPYLTPNALVYWDWPDGETVTPSTKDTIRPTAAASCDVDIWIAGSTA
tara:strand:+ start:161 stop:616 length:456 start_codon:yes stop_codon:yes gene_type:complete